MTDVIRAFAQELLGRFPRLHVQPLRGGLEAEGISLVRAYGSGGQEIGAFVVKPMSGAALREFELHSRLEQAGCTAVAPRLLGSAAAGGDQRLVFLEWVETAEHWPWHQPEQAARVLRELARVHRCDYRPLQPILSAWNYDKDLRSSAHETAELYERLFNSGFRIGDRPMVRPLQRVAEAVIAMRRQSILFSRTALLHGDAHPGNALIDRRNQVVLIDWGRARIGSPLEDVTSWIHSLGFWEPNARRVHDTLLAGYQRARGWSGGLTPAFRAACWVAGACNAMAGALRYHLAVAADDGRDAVDRWDSARAAHDWLRIIRRADALWRN